MAYIPDEAIDRMGELTPGALRLFLFLCRCRNGKTGRCFPSTRVCAEAIDCHPKNIFKLRKELFEKKFAVFSADEATLLFSFKSSENATCGVAAIGDALMVAKALPNGSENATAVAKTLPESRKRYPMVAKTLPNGSENATAYKEEPAKEPAKEPESARAGSLPVAGAMEQKAEAIGESETLAVAAFRQVFGDRAVTIFVTAAIEKGDVTDLDTWGKTLRAWKANGYSVRNVSDLLDKYRANTKRANKSKDWWSRGKTTGTTGTVVSALAPSSEPGDAALAGGGAQRGDGRVADGPSGDTSRPMAAPLRFGAPYTGPETLREVAERRRRDLCVVEVASGPDVECPF